MSQKVPKIRAGCVNRINSNPNRVSQAIMTRLFRKMRAFSRRIPFALNLRDTRSIVFRCSAAPTSGVPGSGGIFAKKQLSASRRNAPPGQLRQSMAAGPVYRAGSSSARAGLG
jgi:hypothetical protein